MLGIPVVRAHKRTPSVLGAEGVRSMGRRMTHTSAEGLREGLDDLDGRWPEENDKQHGEDAKE
jgi:hypothetical protein